MEKSLKTMTKEVEEFCKKRNWNHESPNSLIAAILIEMGELAEHYQWQKEFKEFTEKEKKELGYEFVDVLIYFLRLASKSGIDVEKYFYEKLPKLEKKFPVGKDALKANKEYRENGKNKTYD